MGKASSQNVKIRPLSIVKGEPIGRGPLGRLRRRWEKSIRYLKNKFQYEGIALCGS